MKNNRIQFWRIIFTYQIAFYHLGNVYGAKNSWYIAVEFFFIVSGYLLADSFERQAGKDKVIPAYEYVLKKYLRFFPHALFAFFVAFGVKWFREGYAGLRVLKEFAIRIPEALLLSAIGISEDPDYYCNSVSWYLSALLILSFFIWLLLKHCRKVYLRFLIPVSLLLIYPYLYLTYGSLNEHRAVRYLVLNSALLRGAAGMDLGVLGWYVARLIRKKETEVTGIISEICLLLVIAASFFVYRTGFDILFSFVLFIGVVLAFSAKSRKIFDNKLVDKWAGITLAIYLNHKCFRGLFVLIWPEFGIVPALVWFVFITLYSATSFYTINALCGLLKRKKVE